MDPHRDAQRGAGNVTGVELLDIRAGEGLAVAGGRTLSLSARELGLLTALVREEGRVVSRERLYERVWGTALRPGDRTVDVYVRKLRAKLERVLPEWCFIHTHVGFGYRFAPERSQGFHTDATAR